MTAQLPPSKAARQLAAILLECADALDEDDLRAADAISEVRQASRQLATAVHGRGWGEVYLGLEVADEDELPEGDDPGVPLPTGARVTYQARFDFIVTDPAALLDYLQERIARQPAELSEDVLTSEDGTVQPTSQTPHDEVEAVGTLAYLDGLGSRDYSDVGLEFAGGQEIVRPITQALWEISETSGQDQFPFE